MFVNGYLHLIIGPMFSGKTTALINEINNLKILKKNIIVINSKNDTRVENDYIQTHDNIKYKAVKLEDLKTTDTIYKSIIEEYDIVCIDEAQFFNNLVPYVENLLLNGKYVIVSGLNGDYNQKKFGNIIDLLPLCNKIVKLSALCQVCNDGSPADFTKRKLDACCKDQILIGDNNLYTAVCRNHL